MKIQKSTQVLEENLFNTEKYPEGWKIKKLKDITKKVTKIKPESEPDRFFGYVDISSINNDTNQIVDFKKIRGVDAPSRARQSIQPNDVLFSNVRTYLRNIAIIPDDLDVQVCSTGFTVLRSDGSINPKFLFYYTLTNDFINNVTPQQTGSQYPATTDRVVKDATIPHPPLLEQQRIVNRIKVFLEHVNATRDRLARMPLILRRFRQVVLTSACSGRLTDEWREGKELPEWEQKALKSLSSEKKYAISSGPFGSALGRKDYKNKGIPVIRGHNIKQGVFIPENLVYISDLKANELKRSKAVPGDIVIVAVGSSGQVAMVTDAFPRYILSQNCNKFSFNTDIVDLKFILYTLQTSLIVSEMLSKTTDTARPFLSLTNLKSLEISIPPLIEQHEIVRRVGMLFERADAIDREVAAAGRRCERLTQAILAKAFRGELVQHEAEAGKV